MTLHNFRQIGWLVKFETNSSSFISFAMLISNTSRFDETVSILHEFGVFAEWNGMECVTLKDVHFKEEALIDEMCKKSLYKVQFMSSQQLCADLLIRCWCCWCWWQWWWWWCNLNTLLKFIFQRKCLRFIFTSCAQHIRFSYRWNLIFTNKTEIKKRNAKKRDEKNSLFAAWWNKLLHRPAFHNSLNFHIYDLMRCLHEYSNKTTPTTSAESNKIQHTKNMFLAMKINWQKNNNKFNAIFTWNFAANNMHSE